MMAMMHRIQGIRAPQRPSSPLCSKTTRTGRSPEGKPSEAEEGIDDIMISFREMGVVLAAISGNVVREDS